MLGGIISDPNVVSGLAALRVNFTHTCKFNDEE